MTRDELDKKGDEWAQRIEDVLIEMTSVTTEDGLQIYFTHQKIVDSFMESLAALKTNHASASRHMVGNINAGNNED